MRVLKESHRKRTVDARQDHHCRFNSHERWGRPAQYCDEVRVRLSQCKDFETKRQFLLESIDHIVFYKDLVELHGLVPIKIESADSSDITKIEYKICDQITWAERMKTYWKRDQTGSRISVMDFNNMVGQSKRRMQDAVLFTKELRYRK